MTDLLVKGSTFPDRDERIQYKIMLETNSMKANTEGTKG